MIFQRIKQHLVKHNILVPEQQGFLDGVSTHTATYKFIETVFIAWNKQEYIAGIFCDQTMAFDCVNNELLFSKLKFYGVRDVSLEWLKSHLNNRKKRVDLEIIKTYCYSLGWEKVKCGVLQGSVLGALLFNIYIYE